MHFQKIIKTLGSFSKKELLQFNKFLASPYFNNQTDLILTFQLIVKYIESSNDKLTLEEFVSSNLKKKNKDFKSSRIKRHITTIHKLILQFLSIENWKNDSIEQNLNLLLSYYIKSDKNSFKKLYQSIYKDVIKLKENTKKYKYLYELEEMNWFLKSSIDDRRIGDANLLERNRSFDKYFIIEKLWIAIAIEDRKMMVGKLKVNPSFQKLIEAIELGDWLEDNYIKTLYLAYKLLTNNAKEQRKYFELFNDHLNQHYLHIEAVECKNLFFLVGSLAHQIYKDRNELYSFLFQHNNKLIDDKIVYDHNDCIHYGVFRNIVTVAIRQKELLWAENFVNNHKNSIMPYYIGEDVWAYNLARIYFFKKQYKKADTFILSSRIKDPYYRISIKRLELMISFEKKEWLRLDALINNNKVWLSRQRKKKDISEQHLKNELQFINFIKRLYNVKTKARRSSNSMSKLSLELSQIKSISERAWLNEKLESS